VYTLRGADHPYRAMVEAMSEGAVIIAGDGTIFYSNHSFAAMVATPLAEVIGSAMDRFVLPEDVPRYETLLEHEDGHPSRDEIRLAAKGGFIVPAYLSASSFEAGTSTGVCVVVTDLTEHKRHQELIAAEASERAKRAEAESGNRRIASILESITDSFFALDREWRVTEANDRAVAHFGRTRSELVGSVLWDLAHQDKVPELEEQYRRAMAERVAVHFEGPSAIAPGKWFETHIYPSDEGLAVYLRDITERQRAEDTLRDSEANLAEAQRLTHTGSWTWRMSTGELFWSLEHFRIFGLDPGTFRPTKENTQRLIHPRDLPFVEQTLEKAVRERSAFEVDYRIIRPDGSLRYHHGLGRPLVSESGELEFVGSVVDITERAHAEEQLRRSESYLAESQRICHTGSWAWNISTGELFWSLEHFRICGVDPESFKPTIETVRQLIHPQDRIASTQAFEKAIDDRADFDYHLRFVRPDGTIRHVHSFAHPAFNESGDVIEYVGTIVDITERMKADEERAQLLRQIVNAQENERRRIALEMHDEFGQQLSALVLKLSALKRACGRRANLSQQLASSEAIARQLDRDLDRIVWRLRPTTLDDLGLTAALTHYVKRWSDHFSIHAEFHANGLEPDRLTSEIDTALYRITQEALNNVAKHARAEHVAILLDGRLDRVSVIIEDDGIGFDLESVRPHRRLGVVGMRERAQLLGGTVDIESHPGRGTTVVARIPVPSSPEQKQT
jgi:PAS domain S-box-containing protein